MKAVQITTLDGPSALEVKDLPVQCRATTKS